MHLLRKIKLLIELVILEKGMSILSRLSTNRSIQFLENLKANQDIDKETLNILVDYGQACIEFRNRIKMEINSDDSLCESALHTQPESPIVQK